MCPWRIAGRTISKSARARIPTARCSRPLRLPRCASSATTARCSGPKDASVRTPRGDSRLPMAAGLRTAWQQRATRRRQHFAPVVHSRRVGRLRAQSGGIGRRVNFQRLSTHRVGATTGDRAISRAAVVFQPRRAGGAANTALGEEFVLDGRRTYHDYYHPSQGVDTPVVWSIWEQESQQYILADAPGPVLRFTAPRIGGYQAILHTPNFSSARRARCPLPSARLARTAACARSSIPLGRLGRRRRSGLDRTACGRLSLGLMRRNAWALRRSQCC